MQRHLGFNNVLVAFSCASLFMITDFHFCFAENETPDQAAHLLPPIDRIESMTAEHYCHMFAQLGVKDIEKFQIPQKEYEAILNLFQGVVREEGEYPLNGGEIGTIRIMRKDNEGCVRICWFDRGKNRMRFSVGGRSFIRSGEWFRIKEGRDVIDEAQVVDGYIRGIYERIQKNERLAKEREAALKNPDGFKGNEAGDRRDLVEGVSFRWCPEGKFKMGEEDSAISVELTKGFWLQETEVTQGQWRNLMETTPWKGQGFINEAEDFPATYISHDEAAGFAKQLTNKQRESGRLPKGWKYSLPTEAQWEYACRAGTETKFSFGNNSSDASRYGWFEENTSMKNEDYAHQVGYKKSNAWELKDMHGNVREWCEDWYKLELQGGQDPLGPSSGSDRVFRSGSWIFHAAYCRSAKRECYPPDQRSDDLGFRLAVVSE